MFKSFIFFKKFVTSLAKLINCCLELQPCVINWRSQKIIVLGHITHVQFDIGICFLWKLSLKTVMFTLLCIALRLPDIFRFVTRASNVGYFFLWKSRLKSVMFTLLCIALRLPDTFRCVTRASNAGYLFLWKPSLESVMFTQLCIALRLPDTFRCVSFTVENGKTSKHI